MTDEQKNSIIESGKEYFRTILIPNHLRNLQKLKLDEFNINPFTINYLVAFLCGNTEPESLAKALVYPRILGTSLNTSFGQNIQVFISRLAELTGSASGIDGIDIEFVDALDGRKKYCQCKAGPQTINKDDIATILGHFKHLTGKARLDRLPIQLDDLIVGVLYGEHENLSANYKTTRPKRRARPRRASSSCAWAISAWTTVTAPRLLSKNKYNVCDIIKRLK